MDLSFWVSWLCMLFWGCSCSPPQTGYSFAYGFNLDRSPQTSSNLIPREPLKPTYDDAIDAVSKQNFVSLQNELAFYEDWLRFGFGGSFPEGMPLSQPGLVDMKDIDKSINGQNVWNRQGKFDQALEKSRFFTTPVDFTENIIPSTPHWNRVFIEQSAHHPHDGFAAPELLSNNIPNDGLPGGHNDIFFSVSRNSPARSGSEPPQHRESPSDIFSGENSFINPNAVAAVDASNSPTQDLAFFSKKGDRSAPLGYRSKVHKTKYTPTFSSGFPKVGQSHVLPPPKAPSLNHFIPFNQIYVPNYEGKNKKKKSKSFHAYKASLGKKSKDGSYLPPSLEKASAESASNSKYVFPHLGLKANVPQKEQDGSHLAFTVKPSSPLHGSTGHSGYLGYQTLHSDPFILAANPEYKKKTSHFKPKEKLFPQQNLIHKEISPQAHLGSFSAQDRFLFLNGGYKDAMKAGLLKPISQPASLQTLAMKTEPTNFASWPEELLSERKDPDMNCIIWKNTKSSSQPRSQNSSRSSLNAFIKSKNRSARATTILSRACYKPSQQMMLTNGNGNLL